MSHGITRWSHDITCQSQLSLSHPCCHLLPQIVHRKEMLPKLSAKAWYPRSECISIHFGNWKFILFTKQNTGCLIALAASTELLPPPVMSLRYRKAVTEMPLGCDRYVCAMRRECPGQATKIRQNGDRPVINIVLGD